MLRRIGLELPISILGMVGLVTITQILIRVTDALSGQVLDNFQDDIASFSDVVGTLSHLSGGPASAFVVFVLGLVSVLAGLRSAERRVGKERVSTVRSRWSQFH